MKKKKKISITGANSYIGINLINFYTSKKVYVRAFCRNPKKLIKIFPKNKYLEIKKYSFSDKIIDFSGTVQVIHLAHERTSLSRKNFLVDPNLIACENLVKNAVNYKIKKVIYLSSILAHKNTKSQYGKSKFDCEKIFQNKKFYILRLGFVFGGIQKGIYKQLMKSFCSSSIFPIIFPNKIINPLHIDDLSELLLKSDVMNQTDIPYISKIKTDINLKFFFSRLAFKTLNKKLYFLHLPSNLLYFLTYFLGYYSKIFNLIFERVVGFASLQNKIKKVKECNFVFSKTEDFFDG